MLVSGVFTGYHCDSIGAPSLKSVFIVRKPVPRARPGPVCPQASSVAKDRNRLQEVLGKFGAKQETHKLLEWLDDNSTAPQFTILGYVDGNLKLSDVLENLKKSHDLASLWKETPKARENKHFLVSLVHKVYSKVLERERKNFATEFDKEAAKVTSPLPVPLPLPQSCLQYHTLQLAFFSQIRSH